MKALFGLFLLGTILSFSSCYTGRPLTQAPSQNNRTYEVSYLFSMTGARFTVSMTWGTMSISRTVKEM